MSFFQSQDSFDPASFNYNNESDKVKRRRQIAEGLMQTNGPKGQMVPGGPNGFYVAPSLGEHLSAALQKVLGAYMVGKADDAQKDVDKNSAEAFKFQLDAMNGTGGKGVDTLPKDEPTKDDPQGSGLSDSGEVEQVAQSTPVRPQTELQDLGAPPMADAPTQTISPTIKQAVAEKLTGAGGGRGFVNPPTVTPTKSRYAAGQITNDVDPDAELKAQVMARMQQQQTPLPTAPAPMPQQMPQQAQAPQALPPMPQAQAMPSLTAPAPMPQQAQAPQAPMPQQASQKQQSIGDTIQQLTQIANTGPAGAQYAQTMLAQLSAKSNDFKVELSRDPQSGALAIVRVNGRTGGVEVLQDGSSTGGEKVLETKDTPNGLLERTASGWRQAKLGGQPIVGEKQQAQDNLLADKTKEATGLIQQGEELKKTLNDLTAIDPKTGKPVIDATAGLSGAAALAWNGVTRSPNAASQAQSRVEGLKSQIFAYGMARLKSAGGGAGAANSDAEGKRLEMALGNLDIAKLGTEGFTQRANEIIAEIEANAARIDASVTNRGGSIPQRTPGAAPSPMSYSAFKGGK